MMGVMLSIKLQMAGDVIIIYYKTQKYRHHKAI